MGTVIKSVNGFEYDESADLFRCKDITKYDPNRCPLCGHEAKQDREVEDYFGELRVTCYCPNGHEWTEVYSLNRVFAEVPERADYELWVGGTCFEEDVEPMGSYMDEGEARKAFADAVYEILYGKNEGGNVSVALNRTDPKGSDECIAYFSNKGM